MANADSRRVRTVDRGPPGGGPPLGGEAREPLVVGKLGPNRALLQDGSLLCRSVPIARTGWMQYAPGEVPLEPSADPMRSPVLHVHRGPEDLFNDRTMQSFVGCAVTFDHPPLPVTPQNYSTLGKGFILRVYRGDGPDSDCLMADLVIKDQWTIDRVSPDQEVSCGYEARYEQTGDGQGRQFDIIGNHLALVDKGRCGPRCAIGDEDTLSTHVNEETMTTQATTQGSAPSKRNRIPLAEARARVADAMTDLEHAEQEESSGVHVHVHMPGATKDGAATPPVEKKEGTPAATTLDAAVEARFAKLEKSQEEISSSVKELLTVIKSGVQAPAGNEDPELVTEATATADSAPLATSYQQLLAQAEILVPGFKLPTFDAAMQRKATVDRMCQCRRLVLGSLVMTGDGASLLKAVNGGKDFDVVGSACPDVAVAFKGAAAAKAAANNRSSTADASSLPQASGSATGPLVKHSKSFADLNKAATDFWKTQGPRA